MNKKENKIMKKELMSPVHPEWERFIDLLNGPEGCDFKEDEEKGITWKCKGGSNKNLARKILKKYFPTIDIRKSCKFFEDHGGFCDCEILFNVAR